MKNIILSVVILLGLTACATSQPGFGPASGSDFGYKNTKIQHDHFRISYTSRNGDESKDYALLRAAQIADIEGYSHFKIIDGYSYDNGPGPHIATSIGIGVLSGFGRRGRTNTHVNIGVADVARAMAGDKATETIEIRLLNSGAKTDVNIYDAKSVIQSIQPPVFSTPDTSAPAAPVTTP